MATASGITLVKKEDLNPKIATTFGVGEMINDAISKGLRNFIIGIGGSATNDGGVGMLKALGFEFKDSLGNEIGFGAEALKDLDKIITSNANPYLKECKFFVACDVSNPLLGENGCSYIFAPQKGAKKEELPILDSWLKNYALKTKELMGKDYSSVSGAGAAGGLGFALMAYLNATLKPGIELILNEIGLENEVIDSDIVITGEGKMDSQTLMGKAPIGVANVAKKHGKVVFAFCGCMEDSARVLNDNGIDAIFSIQQSAISLEKAMETETAKNSLTNTVEQALRVYKTCKN
jgi:glycerate kinase